MHPDDVTANKVVTATYLQGSASVVTTQRRVGIWETPISWPFSLLERLICQRATFAL